MRTSSAPSAQVVSLSASGDRLSGVLDLLRCPTTHSVLVREGDALVTPDRSRRYAVTPTGIPLFAQEALSAEVQAQREHYQRIADIYAENLGYPHTQEYTAYLDREFLDTVRREDLGTVAEICCGMGAAFELVARVGKIDRGVGVDISEAMLEAANRRRHEQTIAFVQGNAVALPLADASFDSVFMLGGIHHVTDRLSLFREVSRIVKPGGRFYFREPVSDFLPWRVLRAIIYRLSPALDHETERPLLRKETEPLLEGAGLRLVHWRTHGFLGFCLLMNSDVLVFNRAFRFIPGIRTLTRWAARADEAFLRRFGFENAGLQVVGVAEKPR